MAADTAGALIQRLAERFSAAGLAFGHGYESAWDEAASLVLHVTGLPDDRSVLNTSVGAPQRHAIESLARRRIGERVPLAYLLGRCVFAGHEFRIEPGIVVPRSPIGPLISRHFAPWLRRHPRRILDLCCGCGCIGIAAALAFPEASLDLADLDPAAVALTRRNVAGHRLETRTRVFRSDLFEALPPGQWDLIVTNPPYVDAPDLAALPPEYRHEPTLGLAGGADGLDLVARLLSALPERLADGGLLVCEVGASTAAMDVRFPRLPVIWPELPAGGEGVFFLERASLR